MAAHQIVPISDSTPFRACAAHCIPCVNVTNMHTQAWQEAAMRAKPRDLSSLGRSTRPLGIFCSCVTGAFLHLAL